MKNRSLRGFILGILIVSICSCETRDDSIQVEADAAKSTKKKANLTCDELLNAPENFEGKIITIEAFCWGTSSSIDGEEMLMSIDDNQQLKGLQQAHVLVHFTKAQKKEIERVKENDRIVLTAKVGAYEYGALRLVEAKITPN